MQGRLKNRVLETCENKFCELNKSIKFVETTLEPDFQVRFAEAIAFPHAKDSFPQVEKLLLR